MCAFVLMEETQLLLAAGQLRQEPFSFSVDFIPARFPRLLLLFFFASSQSV